MAALGAGQATEQGQGDARGFQKRENQQGLGRSAGESAKAGPGPETVACGPNKKAKKESVRLGKGSGEADLDLTGTDATDLEGMRIDWWAPILDPRIVLGIT